MLMLTLLLLMLWPKTFFYASYQVIFFMLTLLFLMLGGDVCLILTLFVRMLTMFIFMRTMLILMLSICFFNATYGKWHLMCTCFVLLADRWNWRRTNFLKFAGPARSGQKRFPAGHSQSTLFRHRASTGDCQKSIPKSAQLNSLRFSGRVYLASLI